MCRMTSVRVRHTGKDLTDGVRKSGVDEVNSDEEQNKILDEVQQEKFIEQMTIVATEYVASWKRMLAYTTVVVLYIYSLALVGLLPVTRNIISKFTPNSITVQFLLAPVYVGSCFFNTWLLPALLNIFSLLCVLWTASQCMSPTLIIQSLRKSIRISAGVSLVTWSWLAHSAGVSSVIWGRHLVLAVAHPLFCFAADTFVSSRELAIEGISKLSQFTYSHRKV